MFRYMMIPEASLNVTLELYKEFSNGESIELPTNTFNKRKVSCSITKLHAAMCNDRTN